MFEAGAPCGVGAVAAWAGAARTANDNSARTVWRMCLLGEGLPRTRAGALSCARTVANHYPIRGIPPPTRGWVQSVLRLALRPGSVARGGAAEHFEAEQRTLAPRGGDVDPELLDHPLGGQIADVVDGHSDQLLGGDRRRRLRDRAPVAMETEGGDLAVLHLDVHAQLVTAERVVVVELEVALFELAEVPRALVVIEDVVSVELVHRLQKVS